MSDIYAFVFCIALGIAGRFLFMVMSVLAKRTDILPVTVVLDMLTVAAVGGGFTAYVILTGAVLAPYMFAALFAGYLLTYLLTKPDRRERRGNDTVPEKKDRKQKVLRKKTR